MADCKNYTYYTEPVCEIKLSPEMIKSIQAERNLHRVIMEDDIARLLEFEIKFMEDLTKVKVMKNYIYLDGTQVEISDETAKNLRKEFTKPKLPTFKDCFGENKWYISNTGYVFEKTIGCAGDHFPHQRTKEQIKKVKTFAQLQAVADYLNDGWKHIGYDYAYIVINGLGRIIPQGGMGRGYATCVKFKDKSLANKAIEIFKAEGEYDNLVKLFS